MPGWLVFLVYGVAFFLAVWMDYEFPRVGWYWRVVAMMVALAIGLTPPPPQFAGSGFDLSVGAIFTFLFAWGVSEALFRLFHLPHHSARRHA